MSEPCNEVNFPDLTTGNKFVKPGGIFLTGVDDSSEEEKKPEPEVRLISAEWKSGPKGFQHNEQCFLDVKAEYLKKTIRARIRGKLFAKYNGEEFDLAQEIEGFIDTDSSVARMNIKKLWFVNHDHYKEWLKDKNVASHYIIKGISHSRGANEINSPLLNMPAMQNKQRGWVPFITFSKEYSKVNAYNLSLLANLAYEENDNIKDYFDVLSKHAGRAFKSQRIIASPFLIDTEASDCFSIIHTSEDIFNIKKTDTQGFLALNGKQILISIRGTTNQSDWGNNLNMHHVPYSFGPGHVHKGFYGAFLSIKDKIDTYMHINRKKDQDVIVTGHSLGGAVATLIAGYLHTEKKINNVMLYTFGSPRVGDCEFAKNFSGPSSFPHFRIVNNNDIVPKTPLSPMDLRPQLLAFGGVFALPLALFDPLDDPFSHTGEFIHIKKIVDNGTHLSRRKESSFFVTLPKKVVKKPVALTLEAILSAKGYIDDHDMTKCYCPTLRTNMMKSIESYLGSNQLEVQKLEKEILVVEKEITDLEKNALSIKFKSTDPTHGNEMITRYNQLIEGRKNYVSEHRNRISHYKHLETNKPVYLKELLCTATTADIETELTFQKKLI